MFKLVKEPVAPWPVYWKGVSATGEIVDESCTLLLVRLGETDFNALFNPDPSEKPPTNRELFDRLVRGWEGVVDADKQPLAMDEGNINLLLEVSGFSVAFVTAYYHYWAARPQVREKNSDMPSAGSTATVEPAEAATTGDS